MAGEQSVADLVEAALDGDEPAWGALVDRYAPLLWSVARGFELAPADVDDVAQVVWLRLLEHLADLETPAALPGWLVTTTRRECLQHARSATGRAQREAPLFVEAVPDVQADRADEAILVAERNDALRAAFERLGERCRRLLRLLLLDDPRPSYTEIGDELGIAVGSIGPIRARCLGNLRRTPEIARLRATAVS